MFDIGFPELMVVSIVALLILGPERLPETLRTLGLWMGRLRRSFNAVKTELEQEIGMDDIRRQLHNESVMEEMQRIEAEVQNSLDTDAAANHSSGTENSIAPPDTAADRTNSDNTSAQSEVKSTSESTPKSSGHNDQPADVNDDRARNS